MGSLISDSDKEAFQSVFDDIHDTFAREIKFIKDAKNTAPFKPKNEISI